MKRKYVIWVYGSSHGIGIPYHRTDTCLKDDVNTEIKSIPTGKHSAQFLLSKNLTIQPFI